MVATEDVDVEFALTVSAECGSATSQSSVPWLANVPCFILRTNVSPMLTASQERVNNGEEFKTKQESDGILPRVDGIACGAARNDPAAECIQRRAAPSITSGAGVVFMQRPAPMRKARWGVFRVCL